MSALTDGAAVIGASHPSVSAQKLEKLAEHHSELVRRQVAKNPNTPGHVLKNLVYDLDKFVAEHAAIHPALPYETALLITDWLDQPGLRYSLALNPNLHQNVIKLLVEDTDSLVRQTVASNDCVPVSLLLELADSEDMHVRLGVTKNPNSTFNVLVKLVNCDFSVVFPNARNRFSWMNDRELVASLNPAISRIKSFADDEFQHALLEAGFTSLVGMPRDWAMRALCSVGS